MYTYRVTCALRDGTSRCHDFRGVDARNKAEAEYLNYLASRGTVFIMLVEREMRGGVAFVGNVLIWHVDTVRLAQGYSAAISL